MPINIDYTRDELLDDFAKKTLKEYYMLPGEQSPQDMFARASQAFADDDAHAQRLYDYCSKLWFMYSTPILSNSGTVRGLPISCYISEVGDSLQGLLNSWNEVIWLSSTGGGIGVYAGNLRSDGTGTSKGSKSTGIIPFISVYDRLILATSQGPTRRGALSVTVDISHPEIEEFINIRKPTGGDPNRKSINLHHCINIPDSFMHIIESCMRDKDFDDSWELIDPHTKKVVRTVSAKKLWEQILYARIATGEPFIHFVDTTNRALPKHLVDDGLRVNTVNLCTEITLPTSPDRTAVCCLSSVNLEYFDEWKSTTMVEDLIRMLDNVITYFVRTAPESMWRATYSASQERSLGLGAMGFHAYLQSKGVAFESALAKSHNKRMFSYIKTKASEESNRLLTERGCNDRGVVRNEHLLAIAPNANSSIICGNTSPSIEPFNANAIRQVTRAGSNILKNKYLDKLLKSFDLSDKEYKKIWNSIVDNEGSIQHLNIFSKEEKEVFKTAGEIDQRYIVDLAGDRQQYICQAQSVNLFVSSSVNVGYLHHIHYMAWKQGLKTLYYLRTTATHKVSAVNEKIEKFEHSTEECLSCQ